MFLVSWVLSCPRPTTVWVCPHEDCDYRALGYPAFPLGRGVCKRRTTRRHPLSFLVRETDPGGRGLSGPEKS
jgi:hypothetical protein